MTKYTAEQLTTMFPEKDQDQIEELLTIIEVKGCNLTAALSDQEESRCILHNGITNFTELAHLLLVEVGYWIERENLKELAQYVDLERLGRDICKKGEYITTSRGILLVSQ
ncbi:MAG: hypothetical protein AAGU74_10310 [Bacillota bacterium]